MTPGLREGGALAVSPAGEADDRSPAYVEDVVRRSGTSFYWAMRFLPAEKRTAMFAIYAFCREVDDIADDEGQVAAKRLLLGWWREEIERLYRGLAERPVTRALLRPVDRFALRKDDFLAVIDGMEMDAADRIRIADMDELGRYCDRVACAVGRLSVRVFGVPQPAGDRLAKALGEGLQLTNILRDVHEDARRDRLYLPADLLGAPFAVDGASADAVLRDHDVAGVCARLAEIAQRRFEESAALAAECDRRQVRPAMMMMEVYRRTLQRMAGRGWERWAEPVSISRAEKLWVALRHGMI